METTSQNNTATFIHLSTLSQYFFSVWELYFSNIDLEFKKRGIRIYRL